MIDHSPTKRLAIIGTTASGKSHIAMRLAQSIGNIELVSLDSMQIYKGMDIGTAKPTLRDQELIPHHMIDIINPHQQYTISEFQKEAQDAIYQIETKEYLPLLVGGTGLYLRAVIDQLNIPGQFIGTRKKLELNPDTADLYTQLSELDPLASTRMEPNNRRRIIRALEVTIGSGKRFSSYGPGLTEYQESRYRVIGLRWDRNVLNERIAKRFEKQMNEGFLTECENLLNGQKQLSRTASQALGYKHLFAYLQGKSSLDEAIGTALKDTRQFARKQERWFRRDPRISWININETEEEALPMILKEYEQ
ncbi:MAG: tRNA (adenosine(37)-N6)-dimethylallyltransferase MiaA [Acidimicrobiaceae bacterium]|nr:tRNA (adenosine(37)-N6)-dimethylallyltransferase MiaA [Acidimicrobiaceae bacterium]